MPDGNKSEKFFYICVITAITMGLYLTSLHSYLLFHSLIEITTISIGFSLYILTWNARRFIDNDCLKILGIGYAFVALIDLLHALAYKGMNVFPAYGADLPTQLWIAARYLQAVTLCVAPLFVERKIDKRAIFGVSAVAAALLVTMVYSGNFPNCFIEGKGLTVFKIASEYLISALLLVSLYLFFRKRACFNDKVFLLTAASIAFTAVTEILFTAYISVYGFANLLGHFSKLAAFYLIYRAILVTGLKEPFDLIFRDLKKAEEALEKSRDTLEEKVAERTAELRASEERYRSLIRNVQTAIILHDGQGRILNSNPLAEELLGLSANQLLGKALSYPEWRFLREDGSVMPVAEYPVNRVLSTHLPLKGQVTGISRPDRNDVAWMLVNAEPEYDDAGEITVVIVSFVDITERKQLDKERERYVRFFMLSSDAMCIADPFGNFKHVNPSLVKLTGYAETELVSKPFMDFVLPEDREKTAEEMKLQVAVRPSLSFENRYLCKDGRVVFLSWVAYFDKNDGVTYASARDLTQLQSAEEELLKLNTGLEIHVKERTLELHESQMALINIVDDLNQKTEDLEKANVKLLELDRLKSMFIASMSHELRTPLNSIIGFSSIIRDEWLGPVNPEQKENLDTIQRSGKHLLSLINDVIDVSKIEAGKIEVRYEEFDLYDLLTEAVQYVEKDLLDKGLKLQLAIDHHQLCTDKRRLMQCIINLLSNAVKYTEHGEVTVSYAVIDIGQTAEGRSPSGEISPHPLIDISIADSGIGISEEDIPRIFKPFVRLESPMKTTVPGTGLGLYLTRKLIVEVLGGDILCDSEIGVGSTFILKIPERIYEKSTGSRG